MIVSECNSCRRTQQFLSERVNRMGVLSKFRKKGRGFQDKSRTKEEINQEYNHHAVMYGHASRLIHENERVRDHHMEAMTRLVAEGQKVPMPKPEEKTPETKTEAEIKPWS